MTRNAFTILQRLLAVAFLLISAYPLRADSLAVAQQTSSIALRAYVDSGQIPLNQNVLFHLELSWSGDMSRYQISGIPQPVLTNLLMEGSGSTNRLDPVESGGLRSTKMITYKLRAVEQGMAYIDGLEVNYRDTQTGASDKLVSQRVMVEIVAPVSEGSDAVSSLIYMVLLGIFLLTIGYFILIFLKKRRARESDSAAENATEEEVLLKQIAQDIDPKGTNLNEMVLKLAKLFIGYLSSKIESVRGTETATDLLAAVNASDLKNSQSDKLGNALATVDLVRFAGKKLQPEEFSSIYNAIESFLLEQNSPS
ncbi:MAG: hypothetical protein ACRBF0_05960 [Calditrichia bacterium]